MNPAVASATRRSSRATKAIFRPLPEKGVARVHIICLAKARIRRVREEQAAPATTELISRSHRQARATETSFFRKEPYNGHAIIISTSPRAGGWTAQVTIHDAAGVVVMGPVELCQGVPFTAPELADEAALRLRRAWVDIR